MSTTAPDVVSASHLVAHQGTSPSVTLPVVGAAVPDVDDLWGHLAEPADFFGVRIPPADALGAALGAFLDSRGPEPILTAVTVTAVAGETRYVVTGSAVQPARFEAVRIERCDVDVPLTLPDDPHWRRMAARTTSRADRDRLRDWLEGRGYADAVTVLGACTPFLGALVWERDGETVGLDNPEPTSVLEQMQRCGAIHTVRRVQHVPVAADGVWWLSPDFELHPVSAIGDTTHPISGAAPSFARLS
jgi:hypothetical protein